MKKILAFLGCLAISGLIFVTPNINGTARDWLVGTVAVSTETVTALKVGTYNLTGRYEIRIQNVDPAFNIAIGTSAVMTYATGIIVYSTASASGVSGLTEITLPLNEGTTVYGLGKAQNTDGTIDVRIIELK